jgi:hypothetical protein
VIKVATPDQIALTEAGPGQVVVLDDDGTWTALSGLPLAGSALMILTPGARTGKTLEATTPARCNPVTRYPLLVTGYAC